MAAQRWRNVADCFEEIEQQLAAKREPADGLRFEE
jgi:hypothetical protein